MTTNYSDFHGEPESKQEADAWTALRRDQDREMLSRWDDLFDRAMDIDGDDMSWHEEAAQERAEREGQDAF